jgi:protein tyrosine phosphatase (PTP) superfamily phosphohydrolase (DUF442 family)
MSGMEISKITDYLYIAPRKKAVELNVVHELGVRLVINMIAYRRPPRVPDEMAIEVLWLRTFDFPLLPIPVRKLVQGVEAALPIVQKGHSVLVYCEAGRHRSVAMASAILIGMGYTADGAMQLVRERREVADPWAKHIEKQIRRFETTWIEHHKLAQVG